MIAGPLRQWLKFGQLTRLDLRPVFTFLIPGFAAAAISILAVFNPVSSPEWLALLAATTGIAGLLSVLIFWLRRQLARRSYHDEIIGFAAFTRTLGAAERGIFAASQAGWVAAFLGLAAGAALAMPGYPILAAILCAFLIPAVSALPVALVRRASSDAGILSFVSPGAITAQNASAVDTVHFARGWRFNPRVRAAGFAVAAHGNGITPDALDFLAAMDSGGLLRPPLRNTIRDPRGYLVLRLRGLRPLGPAVFAMALLAWAFALILPDGVLPHIPGPTALYDNFLGPDAQEQEHPDPQNVANENHDPNGSNEGNSTTGNQDDAASASEDSGEPSSEAQGNGAGNDNSATQDGTRNNAPQDESGAGATDSSDSGAGAENNRNTESGTTPGSTEQGQSGDAQSGDEAGGASDGSGSESTASDAGQPSPADGAGQTGPQGQDAGPDAGEADDGTPGADDGQKATSGNQSGKPETPSEGADQNGDPSDGPQPSGVTGGSEGSDGGTNRPEAALDDTGQGTQTRSDASQERAESTNQGASQDVGANVDGRSREDLQPRSDEGLSEGSADGFEPGGHALQPDPAPPENGPRPAPSEIRDTPGDTESDSVVGDPAVTQEDAPERDVRVPIETLLPSEDELEVRQEGALFAEPGQSPPLISDRIAAPRDTPSDGAQPPPVHQSIPAWIADILD